MNVEATSNATDARPTIDFDLHSEAYGSHSQDILDDARERCPVAWADANDGMWVTTKYGDVSRVLTEWETFSSDHDLPEEQTGFPASGTGFRGIIVPESPIKFVPSEADPPLATDIRKLEVPFFTPKALRAREPQINAAIDACLDAVIDSGRIEFQADLATPVPFQIALSIVGIDPAEWPLFSRAATMVHVEPGASDYPMAQIIAAQAQVMELVAMRRQDPQHDVASRLIHNEVQGRSLTDQQVATVLNGLVFAGANTVTAVILFALHWLDGRTDIHARLLEDSKFMHNAIEEFLRVQSPAAGSARNVTGQVELGGQVLERADRVFGSITAANRDPERFECPHEVRPDRPNAREHLAFGTGPHRCTGASLARLETRLILEAVLTRIPDYRVDQDNVRIPKTSGKLNTYLTVPATFTPHKK
jgi:cytochrome P450